MADLATLQAEKQRREQLAALKAEKQRRASVQPAPQSDPLGIPKYVTDFAGSRAYSAMQGAMDTATFGFDDEIGDFVTGMPIGKRIKEQARSQHPVSFTGGQVAGAFMPVTGPATLPIKTATRTGSAAKGALSAAVAGGAYGVGSGDGLGDRATQGAIGASTGAVFGGTLGAILPNKPGFTLEGEQFNGIPSATISRLGNLLVRAGLDPNDVSRGMSAIVDRTNSSMEGPLLPSRLKDEIIKQFGEGVREPIEGFLKGAGNSTGRESAQTVGQAVKEDASRLAQFLQDTSSYRLGDDARISLRDDALEEMNRIGEMQYNPILAQGAKSPEANENLIRVITSERMQKLTADLAEDALDEGIDLGALMQRNPAQAAHWMQSKARQLVDDAERSNDATKARRYTNRRNAILKELEDAVPGYRDARMQYGEAYGNKQAIEFGNKIFAASRDEVKIEDMARAYNELTPSQKVVAKASIRDAVLSSAMQRAEGGAPRLVQINKEPFQNALERIIGPDGLELANDIKAIAAKREADLNISTAGSNTMNKSEAIKFANETVANPFVRFAGKARDALGIDAGISTATGGPVPLMTARGVLSKLGEPLTRGRQNKIDDLARLLMTDVTPSPPTQKPPPPGGVPPNAPQQSAPALTGPAANAPKKPKTTDEVLSQYDIKGMSFAGAAGKTADMNVLATARRMHDEGATRTEIWNATSKMGQPWYRDEDGKLVS